jgi:hypothetical protein
MVVSWYGPLKFNPFCRNGVPSWFQKISDVFRTLLHEDAVLAPVQKDVLVAS